MTVQELTQLLSQYPSYMRVVVDGYEDGFDDVERHRMLVREIRLDVGNKSWEGRHRDANDTRKQDGEIVNALVLHRASS